MIGPAPRIPGLEVDLLLLYLFTHYFLIAFFIQIVDMVRSFLVGRVDGTQWLVRPRVESPELLVGGVPG